MVNIGNEAFNCCEELESIIVENSNAVYDSRENCNAIIETPTNTLIVGCKKTFIPNNVRKIEYLSCEGMQDLYCYAESVPVATINYPYSTTLYVPVGSVEAYKATSPWSKFKEILAIGDINAINTIGDEMHTTPTWYNMNGFRLNGKPNKRGIYIVHTSNGKSRTIVIN